MITEDLAKEFEKVYPELMLINLEINYLVLRF